MSDLARRGISAAKWGVGLSAARVLVQLGSQAALARALGPDTYGIFGMAMVTIALMTSFSEFGLGMFVMQRRDLGEVDLRFARTWQLVLGTIGALALWGAAPWVAGAFNEPRVEPVLRWLSITCVLTAGAYTATYLMYRDLQFRLAGLIELTTYIVGFLLIGLPLALGGAGVGALVAAFVSQAALKLVAATLYRRHSWKPRFTHPEAREIVRLGASVWFTLAMVWLVSSLDRIVVARVLGATAVGLYNAAYNLSNAAVMSLGTLSTTFLSSGARVRDEPDRLRRAFVEVFSGVWVIGAPCFVMVAMLSDPIIATIYGSRWLGAAELLLALLVAAPAVLSFSITTPMLWNSGLGRLEPLLQLPVLAVYAAALYAVAAHGLVSIVWVAAAMTYVRAFAAAFVACRVIGLPVRALLPQLGRSAGLCLTVVGGALSGERLGESMHLPMLATAAVSIAIPLAVLLGLVVRIPAVLGHQARAIATRVAPGLAVRLGRPSRKCEAT